MAGGLTVSNSHTAAADTGSATLSTDVGSYFLKLQTEIVTWQ